MDTQIIERHVSVCTLDDSDCTLVQANHDQAFQRCEASCGKEIIKRHLIILDVIGPLVHTLISPVEGLPQTIRVIMMKA